VLEHKKSSGGCLFSLLPNAWLRKNCSGFFISVTSHQILVFGIKGLGEQICKSFESFYKGLVW